MANRKIKLTDYIILVVFIFFFVCFLMSVSTLFFKPDIKYNQTFVNNPKDEFDVSLLRLNTISKVVDYCDSIYKAQYPTRTYPGIVSETIRKRFYHGYSYYDLHTNIIGVLLQPIVKNGATAIVIPDDLIRHASAACSQQSIVGMEVFKRKGYNVRKVEMFDSVMKSGHFAFEVYYEGGWHFFDSDQEPDNQILKAYNRPSADFLAKNPTIVLEAYRNRSNPELFARLLASAKVGETNEFPALHAYIYQVITKFMTYFGWIIILLAAAIRHLLFYRRKQFTISYYHDARDTAHRTILSRI
jgi:hypothetical protein